MTSRERLEAWLLPLGAPLLATSTGLAGTDGDPWRWVAAVGAALVAGAGLRLRGGDRLGGVAATAGSGLAAAAILGATAASPTLAFVVLASLATFLLALWAPEEGDAATAPRVRDARLRTGCAAAALAALGCWFFVVLGRAGAAPWNAVAVGASFVVAAGYAARWALRHRRAMRVAAVALALAALAGAGAAAWAQHFRWAASILAAPFALVLVTTLPSRDEAQRWLPDLDHPVHLLVTTFAFLSALGGLLLMLPVCAADGRAIPPLAALFTSTSAVCVTGLIVLDTPTAFSPVGHAVLLLLIQVGGLGIMTFSTAALGMLGRRLSVRQENAMAGLVGSDNRRDLFRILRATLVLTVAVEAAGAALLAALFHAAGEPAAPAAWRGLFTAVSAFCNAGFALQTDSLMGFRREPLILHVVALLIVLGSLSPVVLTSLPALARRQRVALRVKLALAATGVLLAGGFVLLAALEWSGPAFAGLSVTERLHNAWLMSAARTAGFSSVDCSAFGDASATLLLFLMFVGGSPGSTAGGIKTTTLAVVACGVIAALRGRGEPEIFGRRIGRDTFVRATSIVVLGLVAVLGSILALQAVTHLPYRMVVFEAVSALATVGFSLGATPLLDGAGLVLVMLCMLAGRVGPLSAFVFFLDRRTGAAFEYPAEDVQVG